MTYKVCVQCNATLPKSANFCRSCGVKQKNVDQISDSINKQNPQHATQQSDTEYKTTENINGLSNKNVSIILLVGLILAAIMFLPQVLQKSAGNETAVKNVTKTDVVVIAPSPDTNKKSDDEKPDVFGFEGPIAMNSGWGAILYLQPVSGDLLLGLFEANSKIGEEILAKCAINRYCKMRVQVKPMENREIEKDLTPERVSRSFEIIKILSIDGQQ